MIKNIYEAGLSQHFYYAFFCIGIIAAYVFLVWYGRKIALKAFKVIIAVALGSVGVLCIMGLSQKALIPLEHKIPIMNSYLNNMGRAFIFVPLVAIIVSVVLKISWAKVCNLYSFTQTIIWGFASLGCLFADCCKGYPCEWGIYNAITEIRLFPTQIINSVALLSVAVLIYLRCKKRAYVPDGKEYPLMLIFVGAIRFFTEFLMDNSKIVLGLSSLSFDALIMCAVGIALYVLIGKKVIRIQRSA